MNISLKCSLQYDKISWKFYKKENYYNKIKNGNLLSINKSFFFGDKMVQIILDNKIVGTTSLHGPP